MIFAFRSTLFSAGIPNFQQDWRWPYSIIQLRSALGDVLRVWNFAGLGEPRTRIVNHPVLWLIHWLSFLTSSKALLCAGIVLTVFFTGAGVMALARALRVSAPVAVCAGIIAALGPPMFNKFVAGHWYYMISIAATPWALACAARYEGRNFARAVATGSLVALTALQPQLWVITLAICIALFAFGPNGRDARRILEIGALIVCGAVLTVPELYGAVAAHSAAAYAGMQTIPMWEANNSAPFLSALIGLGYAPGYAERALTQVPWVQIALWLVAAGACVAAFLRRNDRRITVLAVSWLFVLCLVAGVKGPLAWPLQYLYDNYLWASAFRELYHFAEPMWILASVLACVCIDCLRPRPAVAAAAVLSAAILALWLPPAYAGQLQSWPYVGKTDALFSQHTPSVGSRYLLTPAVQPLGPPGTDYHGVDPDANAVGNWFPANNAEQYGVIGATLLLGERDPQRYAGWLRAAGVNAVLPRPYLQSTPIDGSPLDAAQKMQAKRYFPTPQGARAWYERAEPLLEARSSIPVVRDAFTAKFDDGFILERELYSNTGDPDSVAPAFRGNPDVPRSAWNPATEWVRAGLWWWLDPQIAFWPSAALTWSAADLPVPAGYAHAGYAHVVLFHGTLFAGKRPLRLREGIAKWVALAGASTLHVHGAALVIEFARIRGPYSPLHLSPAHAGDRVVHASFSPECLCGSLHLTPADRWVVLKQSYNDNWRLRVDDGRILRHVVFAGYGNAWQVRVNRSTAAFVDYAPRASWDLLVRFSLLAWVLIAIGSAVELWRR